MDTHSENPVLQPVTVGRLQLKNRIVTAPMTRTRSDDAGYSDWPEMRRRVAVDA
ncbi:hypothetical protein [Paraburkholderia fungorum]|uniref:oxidoreductase n=1 Tax=Paraburkholderia fungorum TaxID=134537 RepID=UPI000E77EB2B|nr:hypothetical protein [Paraburkholderia fungorum]